MNIINTEKAFFVQESRSKNESVKFYIDLSFVVFLVAIELLVGVGGVMVADGGDDGEGVLGVLHGVPHRVHHPRGEGRLPK